MSSLVTSSPAVLVRALALFGLLFVLPLSLSAASRYIRTGATGTGDGLSWANAYPTFTAAVNAGLVRGDTYYIAGGDYGTEFVYLRAALAGTTWIYFKKANTTDNGSDPGWNPAYETTVAKIKQLDLDNGYISFDGVTGSGTSGHGIHVMNPNPGHNNYAVLLENGKGPFVLKHLNIQGAGFASGAGSTIGIYYNNSSGAVKNLHVANCWIHEFTTNGLVFIQCVGTSYSDYGVLFENNVLSETGGCTDPDLHGQGMQLGLASEMAYIIIRNNEFRNIVGSGMIVFLSGFSGANHHDIRVLNNIFHYTDTSTYFTLSPGVIWAESDRGGLYTNVHLDNMLVANNTFYNLTSIGSGVSAALIIESPNSGNSVINNVWENCRITGGPIGFSFQSNNGYFGNILHVPVGTPAQVNGSSSTFVDAAAGNFSMKVGGYAIGVGSNQNAIFTDDFTGLVRGGTWDLGALQFGSTAALPGPPPVGPSNAQVSISVH